MFSGEHHLTPIYMAITILAGKVSFIKTLLSVSASEPQNGTLTF